MQTAVKIIDFSAQGNVDAIDKVAIKLSGKNDAVNRQAAANFMEIMGTMMRLDPEQVQASLDQFEKVPLEGDTTGGSAPLIDLSGKEEGHHDLLALLMGQARSPEDAFESDDDDASDNGDDRCDHCTGEGPAPMDVAVLRTIQPELQPIGSTAPAAEKSVPAVSNPVVPELKSPAGANNPGGPKPALEVIPKQPPIAQTALSDSPGGSTAGPDPSTGKNPTIEQPMPKDAVPRDANQPVSAKAVVDASTKVAPAVQELAAQEMTRKSGLNQTKNSASARPDNSKSQLSPTGPPDAVAPMKQVLGEKVQVAPQPTQAAGQSFNADAEEGTAGTTKLNFDSGDTQARSLVGRDGFQSMMARLGSHSAHSTGDVPADRALNEPSRELQNDVMRQIVQRMTLSTQGGQSKMQIHLKPEFLGNVHMQISTDNQQVAIRMTAESMAVKEMIEQHLSFLKAELHHHGLEIDKFDVQVGNDSEGWKSSQDPSGFRQALKNGQQDQSDRQRKEPAEEGEGDSQKKAPKEHESTSEIDYFA